MPKVSVCVPVYNAEKTIRDTLESVLQQTEPDWELVIQDNASTDGSFAIIDEFASRHSGHNIRVIRKHATAPAHENWQSCIREAQSSWIKLLFADDVLYPQCLEWQLTCADENPGVVLVSSRRDILGMNGRVLLRARGHGRLRGRFTRAEVVNEILRTGGNPLGEPEAVLFSRSASAMSPGFTSKNPYVVDLDYWIKILGCGDGFADPRVAGAFRVTDGSASIALLGRQFSLFRSFIRELQAAGFAPKAGATIMKATALSLLNAAGRAAVYLVNMILR